MRLAVLLALAACSVGEYGNTPPGDGKPIDSPIVGAKLEVSATASTSNGTYTPNNIDAIWIEGPAGFVKTIGRWADIRKQYLLAWMAAAGANDADAVSGATRASYTPPLTATWDLKDRQGQVIPDGTYTVRMESTDLNATTPAQNNQGMFTFVKGPTAQMQTALSNGGFSNVSITFTP
jgi:hypothetical protein